MGLKENVNRIHSQLSDIYSEVEINEKQDIKSGSFVQFSITNEGKKLILNINKVELENDNFSWSYYSNPNELEHLVERFSSVNNFSNDVKDIFEKNRFSTDYLQNLN
jgi:hypothetical protein